MLPKLAVALFFVPLLATAQVGLTTAEDEDGKDIEATASSGEMAKDNNGATTVGTEPSLRIPLTAKGQWQVLKYRSIPPNKIQFTEEGMEVNVNKSASPLIYPLSKSRQFKSMRVAGTLKGRINLPADKRQGDKGIDDYTLRVGLVVQGERTLSFFQRKFAPNWVTTLFELAPKGVGVEHIHFYNATADKETIGREREHPLSDLIKEKNQWFLRGGADPKTFEFVADIDQSKKILALWISIDGDDTNSKYSVLLRELELLE